MYMLNMVIILIVMYCNVVTAIDKIPTYLLRFNKGNRLQRTGRTQESRRAGLGSLLKSSTTVVGSRVRYLLKRGIRASLIRMKTFGEWNTVTSICLLGAPNIQQWRDARNAVRAIYSNVCTGCQSCRCIKYMPNIGGMSVMSVERGDDEGHVLKR